MGMGATCTRACRGVVETSSVQGREDIQRELDRHGITGAEKERYLKEFDAQSVQRDKDSAKVFKWLLLGVSFSMIVFWLYTIAGVFTPFLAMNDFQNRNHVMILARPVERWEYLAGKFSAILGMLLLNLTVLLASFHAFFFISIGEPGFEILKGVAILLEGMAVFVSMMMLFSLIIGRIPSMIISLMIVAVTAVPGLFFISGKMEKIQSQMMKTVVLILGYALPQFGVNFFYGLGQVMDIPGMSGLDTVTAAMEVLKQAGNKTGLYSIFINLGWLAAFWTVLIYFFQRRELET